MMVSFAFSFIIYLQVFGQWLADEVSMQFPAHESDGDRVVTEPFDGEYCFNGMFHILTMLTYV